MRLNKLCPPELLTTPWNGMLMNIDQKYSTLCSFWDHFDAFFFFFLCRWLFYRVNIDREDEERKTAVACNKSHQLK